MDEQKDDKQKNDENKDDDQKDEYKDDDQKDDQGREPFLTGKYWELCDKINGEKQECARENIIKLESIWFSWLNQQKEMKQVQSDKCEQNACDQKCDELKQFFVDVKEKFLVNKLYKSMTLQQMNDFWDDAKSQVVNKIKLYDEIEKLKLLSLYPSNCKRSYSKQANIILKKWLIDNYTNPYPTGDEVQKMALLTKLSEKQILNWFINARNNFKNRSMNDKKFRKVVCQRYQELLLMKKDEIAN